MVIEVLARLGETTLDHDFVAPGSVYQLGSTRLVAKAGTHRVGLVDVTMERTFRVDVPVGHPALAWRLFAFIGASLALHLTIWAIAMFTTPIEKVETSPVDLRPRIVIRIEDHTPPPPKPKKAAARQNVDAVGAASQQRRTLPDDERMPTSADMGAATAAAIARLARSVPDVKKAMENVGPHFDEDHYNSTMFGGGTWDINSDPDYDTIKTGPGYDLSELAYAGNWDLGMSKEEKALMKIKGQTALAHKSAIRGDCVPAHRIAKWLHKLDEVAFKEIFMGDPEIVWCLGQPIPPSHIKADAQEGIRSAMRSPESDDSDGGYKRRH
ncbi:MAG TPA: hypothetical protein VL326_15245 [Kofleriaceae bacterium]|nr:hypothetical protein [Kofleriaceae bacterium]